MCFGCARPNIIKISTSIMENSTDGDDGRGIGVGLLLIQRYMSLECNTLAALCNAIQEPGERIIIILSHHVDPVC